MIIQLFHKLKSNKLINLKKHIKNIIFGIFVTIYITFLISPNTTKHKEIMIHCSNLDILTKSINNYIAQGWKVKHIESQSVATSMDNYYTSHNKHNEGTRDLYGEIIVILEKQE